MRCILASSNPGKLREFREILENTGIALISKAEAGIIIEPEETGDTFLENAQIKARAICAASGLPAVADDSGLAVGALGGAPGVHSARFGGPGLTDADRCALLLDRMRGRKDRSAKFICTIVCAFPDGREITSSGECVGEIADAPAGADGFGYDPIFYLRECGKTMAQLAPGEKNTISHRGNALREFAKKLHAFQGE